MDSPFEKIVGATVIGATRTEDGRAILQLRLPTGELIDIATDVWRPNPWVRASG